MLTQHPSFSLKGIALVEDFAPLVLESRIPNFEGKKWISVKQASLSTPTGLHFRRYKSYVSFRKSNGQASTRCFAIVQRLSPFLSVSVSSGIGGYGDAGVYLIELLRLSRKRGMAFVKQKVGR
jgi:hypothetical protein